MTYTSGRIDITATAIDAIIHGAGNAGNTSLLRTQDITGPDGQPTSVPFVSGNSFRHSLRDAGSRHALESMGVPDGSLSKPVVDLLFSGGHLSKAGAAVDLAKARGLARVFPLLSVFGYSAGNVMEPGKLFVDNLHVVCAENTFRLPPALLTHEHAALPGGNFRSEGFGTRHEASRSPHVAKMLTAGDRHLLEGRVVGNLAVDKAEQKKGDSSQMIYQFQCINPGAMLFGGITFRELSDLELAAFRAALGYASEDKVGDAYVFRLGAKSGVGYGRVAVQFSGAIRTVAAPTYEPNAALTSPGGAVDEYTAHLREHRDEILKALEEATA